MLSSMYSRISIFMNTITVASILATCYLKAEAILRRTEPTDPSKFLRIKQKHSKLKQNKNNKTNIC